MGKVFIANEIAPVCDRGYLNFSESISIIAVPVSYYGKRKLLISLELSDFGS